MLNESLLPVGSCIMIKNNPKTIMISGYLPYNDEEKKVYDYIGIYAPVGIRKKKGNLKLGEDYIFINDEDIEKIIFIGYSDNKSDFYRKYLFNIKNKINKLNEDLSLEIVKAIMKESLPNLNNIKGED